MTAKTRAALTTEANANLADNTTRLITAALVRSMFADLIDSATIGLTDQATAATSFAATDTLNGTVGSAAQTVSGTVLSAYLATATLAAGTITTSQPMTLTQTWNAAGVTFTGFKVNITSTASAAASLIADFQVGSVSAGALTKSGTLTIQNPADTSVGTLNLGASASATGLNRNGNNLIFNLAGSQYANLSTGGYFVLASTLGYAWAPGSTVTTTPDLIVVRDAANALALKNGNNDQTLRCYSTNSAYSQIQSLSESTTLSGATTDTAIQFPANCIPLGVTLNVTTLIAGATTFNVGDAASATRYGTALAVAQGTTNAQAGTTNPVIPSAGTKVRFTAVGGAASFSAGVVRVTLHYISLSAPTS